MRLFVIILFTLVLPSEALAQAFGVQMGEAVSKYAGQKISDDNPVGFRITPPAPNPEFESYGAWATPRAGVCKVTAIGKNHENDRSGLDVRRIFSNFKEALTEKYGRSKSYDFLHAGSTWNKSYEYGWSLYKGERSLAATWGEEEGSSNLGNIDKILLEAEAVSPNKTYITLSYEYTNFNACRAALDEMNKVGL